jgi:hypothetical protein
MQKLWGIAGQIERVMPEISNSFTEIEVVGSSNYERYAEQTLVYDAGLTYGQNNVSLMLEYVLRSVGTEIVMEVRDRDNLSFLFASQASLGHLAKDRLRNFRTFSSPKSKR